MGDGYLMVDLAMYDNVRFRTGCTEVRFFKSDTTGTNRGDSIGRSSEPWGYPA
jgi:hypothetical protein